MDTIAKPESGFRAVLSVYPTRMRAYCLALYTHDNLHPKRLDKADDARIGWIWELMCFNSDKDFPPFRIESNWIYYTAEKAKASGEAAAKLLKIELARVEVAEPYSAAAIEWDKTQAAWHDGSRVDAQSTAEGKFVYKPDGTT